MSTNLKDLPGTSDEELWRLSRDGDRDAFGRIVERYMSLVSSLAYSACGSLAGSEDLAQEAFVAAWQSLRDLREPSKLRAWLCGIVRNLAANASRRSRRRGGNALSLDAAPEPVSSTADPALNAVTREEEALLWRSLATLPEAYREPLVLFYRQGKSVAEVAESLELSQDAVKQRLSRGRGLLRDELAAVVESTLSRTRPGSAFAVAVLAALPVVSASTTGAAYAASSVAAARGAGALAKGVLGKLGAGTLFGPAIGLVCAYLGLRAAASTARSREERDCILRYALWRIIPFCFAMSIGLAAVLSQAGKLYTPSAAGVVLGVCAWTAALVGGILLFCRRMDREVRRIRIRTGTTDDAHGKALAAQGKRLALPRYFESRTRLLGLPLAAIAWGGAGSDRYRPRAVYAWIAIGDIALSPLLAVGGVTVAPIAVGAITVGVLSLSVFWGVALGVLAVGSLAFGWWAFGCAAAGVRLAVGFAAVASDYAVGIITSAAEAGTRAAKDWLMTRWLTEFNEVIVHRVHWWLLGCVVLALALSGWRRLRSRRYPPVSSTSSGVSSQ